MDFAPSAVRPPLVLVVDPIVASRHFMWRVLSGTFGVLEAGSAATARTWIARRPDIDALVVEDDLPDERGIDLIRGLANARHPIASRAIVLAHARPEGGRWTSTGPTWVDRGDLRGILSKLATWISTADAGLAERLLREAERFQRHRPRLGQVRHHG